MLAGWIHICGSKPVLPGLTFTHAHTQATILPQLTADLEVIMADKHTPKVGTGAVPFAPVTSQNLHSPSSLLF